MTELRREDGAANTAIPAGTVVVARPRGRRLASLIALGVLGLFILSIAAVWIERRPIATHYLKRELERRGVVATYQLDRVGFRTQQVSDLVIGDPNRPDLVARYARTHAPFTAHEVAVWFGLGQAVVTDALRRLVGAGRLVAPFAGDAERPPRRCPSVDSS